MDYAILRTQMTSRKIRGGYLGAAITGILLVLPFPLIDLNIVAWFALVPLLLAIGSCAKISDIGVRESVRHSFVLGYICGFAWNIGSLFWVRVYDPLVLPLMIFILSFYPAFFCAGLNTLLRNRDPIAMIWAAPLLWTSLEYVRSLGFLGFPWNSLGYSQYQQIPIIQIAEFTGVFGVTFLIVFVNSGVACCLLSVRKPQKCLKILATICIVTALSIFWGRSLLQESSIPLRSPLPPLLRGDEGGIKGGSEAKKNFVRVALIQGNIGADCAWEQNSSSIIGRLLSLTSEAGYSKPDLIIWPETAVGENLETAFVANLSLKKNICHMVKETGAYLLTGCPYSDKGKDYNSAFLISPDCELIDRYDKIHLVPAGEYFPFWRHAKLIEYLLRDAGDFTPGTRRTIFEIPARLPIGQAKAKFGTLICFEGIFGEFTRRFVKDGAGFLINITNDGWSRSRVSHYQHASMATFRAVENRVYFVRVGNSGVSRVINPYGRIEKNLDAYRSGILVSEVYGGVKESFYTRYGDIFAKLVLVLTFLLAVMPAKKGTGSFF